MALSLLSDMRRFFLSFLFVYQRPNLSLLTVRKLRLLV
jgi:hypothetical protein